MNRQTKLLAAQPQPLGSPTQIAGNLQRNVSARLMHEFGMRIPPPLIRRVLDEAMEVAQETGFPNLFFPTLAEEKARFVMAALGDHPFVEASRTLRTAA